MSAWAGHDTTSRKEALAKARQSRRPSRIGSQAGAAAEPDHVLDRDAGFPGLLKRAWHEAVSAPTLAESVCALMTLGGYVPADIQLRALRLTEQAALKVLCGLSFQDGSDHPVTPEADDSKFLGEIGLTTTGRIAVRVPSQGPLGLREDLVGGVLRVPWSERAIASYQAEVDRATERSAQAVADCRQWLAALEPAELYRQVEQLKEAARRTAPFVLYQEDMRYTNFRERNTLTGKTLWPGHADCALSALSGLPLELWSDNDVVLVVCLTLLVRSAGYGRIEEANGTQLTTDHISYLLERTRGAYNGVPGGTHVPAPATTKVSDLCDLADALRARRGELSGEVKLYREIHGPLMHKVERVADPSNHHDDWERQFCARLRRHLPVAGETLDELGASVAAAPAWLADPHGKFGTGLESVVHETVCEAQRAFDADFAMSRGVRPLSALVAALREENWEQLTKWEVPEFFCCVVPAPEAARYFGGSPVGLADIAWAMSARMQYNSWHFMVGNLPRVPSVTERDFFVPPTIPDLAYYSDQHHRGHVAARVRFSIRSPQAVTVSGRLFNGFVDLRLLRCDGERFEERDLIAADRVSAFVATATGAATDLAAEGADIDVTSFDTGWHLANITSRSQGVSLIDHGVSDGGKAWLQ